MRPGPGAEPPTHPRSSCIRSRHRTIPPLVCALSNAISARLGGQQHLSIQSMGRSVRRIGELSARKRMTETIRAAPCSFSTASSAGSGPDIASSWIRLTAPHSTAPVWSDRFVVRTNELFSAEDVIAERVVAALDLRLAAVEQDRLRRRYTSNGAALTMIPRTCSASSDTHPTGLSRPSRPSMRALQLDCQVRARARRSRDGLRRHVSAIRARGRSREMGRADRNRGARRARRSTPDLAEAHLARAAVARKREFDWNTTMTASRRAAGP